MNTDKLIPIAVELIGSVRDYGPDTVAEVLARVPAGRHDALAVVLAAMVDPDKSPAQLLAWMDTPVQSREFTPPVFQVNKLKREAKGVIAERRAEVGRLWAAGHSIAETAERMGISKHSVSQHRRILRGTADAPAYKKAA